MLFNHDDITAYRYTFGQEMLYRPKNIPLDDFVESYSQLTGRIFNIRGAVQRGMRAPRAKAAVLFFNLFYAHLYRLSRKDLRRQIDEASPQRKSVLNDDE